MYVFFLRYCLYIRAVVYWCPKRSPPDLSSAIRPNTVDRRRDLADNRQAPGRQAPSVVASTVNTLVDMRVTLTAVLLLLVTSALVVKRLIGREDTSRPCGTPTRGAAGSGGSTAGAGACYALGR